AAEAPWWVPTPQAVPPVEPKRAPPSPDAEPWWVTQSAAEAAETSPAVLPTPMRRKRRAASLVCLLAGAVCLGGTAIGLALIYRSAERATEPRDGHFVATAQPSRTPKASRPVQSAAVVLPQSPGPPEKIARPAEALPSGEADLAGPPPLPDRP